MKLDGPQVQEQQPRLVITPQMRQSLALLRMPLAELEIYVARQLTENCLLEQEADRGEDSPPEDPDGGPAAGPEPEWMEYFADGRDLGMSGAAWPEPDDPPAAAPSLQDHLLAQVRLLSWPERQRRIGEFLIGNLAGDGYLRSTVAECASALGVTDREAEEALRSIQTLEPLGVGARDLRECLLIQLRHHEGRDAATASLAAAIVETSLGDLAMGRQAKIAAKLAAAPPAVRAALDLIGQLDPRPGRNFGPLDPGRLIPDATLRCEDGGWLVAVNDGAAAGLRISPVYRRMLAGAQPIDQEALEYLRAKLSAAVALIRGLEQRRATLARVAEAIVRLQRPFFTEPGAPLRPLTLREVAAEVGLHESTVSRAAAGKYLQTPRGIFGFRHFFGAGPAGPGGGAVAAAEVRRLIRQTIAGEKPSAPLSDQEIAALLQKLGIRIARRTVAKYREELGIPAAQSRGR